MKTQICSAVTTLFILCYFNSIIHVCTNTDAHEDDSGIIVDIDIESTRRFRPKNNY